MVIYNIKIAEPNSFNRGAYTALSFLEKSPQKEMAGKNGGKNG